MKAEISSRFPIWRAEGDSAVWVIPIAGGNTQLQYGRFKDLDMESLRPARDGLGAITVATSDGKIRGQVRIRDVMRHIDIYAKSTAGTAMDVNLWKPWQNNLTAQGARQPAVPGKYLIASVRATRLRALYLDEGGAPWVSSTIARADRMVAAELADYIWDRMIERMPKPRPTRASAHNNPWVWVYRLEQDSQ